MPTRLFNFGNQGYEIDEEALNDSSSANALFSEIPGLNFTPDLSQLPVVIPKSDTAPTFTPPSFADTAEALMPEATPFNRSSTLQARMAELASKEAEAYKAALETPQLDKSRAFALALPTLLGTLIGAAFRGKKGANVGMQAGAAGSLLGLKGEQADLENKQKLNLINAQRLEKQGAGLQKAQLDDEKARLKFENDKQLIDYRNAGETAQKIDLNNRGLLFRPDASGSDAIGAGAAAELSKITGRQEDPNMTVDQANVIMRSKGLGTGQDREQRLRKAQTAKLASRAVPGFDVIPGSVPLEANVKDFQKVWSAGNELTGLISEMKALLAPGGAKYLGDEGKRREQIYQFMMTAQKNLDQMGANFTVPEMGIVEGKLADVNTFQNYLTGLALGRSPIAALDSFMQLTNENMANRATGIGLYRIGHRYKPEILANISGAIPLDKSGRAARSGWYDQEISGVGGLSGSQSVTPVQQRIIDALKRRGMQVGQ